MSTFRNERPVNRLQRWAPGILSGVACLAVMAVLAAPTVAADVSNKVVLANADKYEATFQVGKLSKTIAPRKASVLSPKKYPITIDYWSGNKQTGWQKVSVDSAGIYAFRYQGGVWKVTKVQKRQTTVAKPAATAPAAKQPTTRKAVGTSRAVARSGGGATAVARGGGGGWGARYGRRLPHLSTAERILWNVGSIWRFASDERDRSLVRKAIKDGINRDREWDKALRDWAKNPKWNDDQRAELYRSLDELNKLGNDDWKSLDQIDENDWNQLEKDLGDQIGEKDWGDFKEELDDLVDTNDLTDEEVGTLDEAGLEDLDTDVDVGDLDVGDVDTADVIGDVDVDIDDLSIDAEDMDFSAFEDFDLDVGDLDGGDVDVGDWDSGDWGLDDYDVGGGDDWGGDDDWGADDWGGDDWGGDDWGGDDFGGFDDW